MVIKKIELKGLLSNSIFLITIKDFKEPKYLGLLFVAVEGYQKRQPRGKKQIKEAIFVI